MDRIEPAQRDRERRAKILRAAARVFARDGLDGASMRAIAREAGCTTGAVYPLFEGKDDLYGHLLEQSLTRLHAVVASACAVEADAMDALVAAASAWHEYYLENPLEGDLGLYLHGSGTRRGLGPERDRELNTLLLRTLDIFGACFVRLASPSVPADEVADWAREERDLLFAQLIGILMLARSGRARSIGSDAEQVLNTALRGLRERLLTS